jgi:tetratricopeptide (TPR) repeat protein
LDASLMLRAEAVDQSEQNPAHCHPERSRRLDPNAAVAHYNKGRVLLDLRRDSDAKPEFETATRLDPRSAESWYLLGLIEKSAGNAAASAQMLQKPAALNPTNPDTLFVLGQELLHSGDLDGASLNGESHRDQT